MDSNTVSYAHGFGATPQFVSWRLICTDAGGDAGWGLNSQLNIDQVLDITASEGRIPQMVNTSVVQIGPYPWATEPLYVPNGTTGAWALIDVTKWKFQASVLKI